MTRRTTGIAAVSFIIIAIAGIGISASTQQSGDALTNEEVIALKKAGISDEVIILRIQRGPTNFKTNASDLIALKDAGISDAVLAAILKGGTGSADVASGATDSASPLNSVDLSKAVVVARFDVSVEGSGGLADATRAAVVQFLRDGRIFSAVVTPEEVNEKVPQLEITATLVDFAPGNRATRIVVGLGTGRAHAGFNFVMKDKSGSVVWKKNIKETASFWSNSASSSAQRLELPEKIAKTLAQELKKANLTVLR